MKLGGLKLKNESFNFDNGEIVHFNKLFHITCIVHLYHNITGKIISHYSNINELIISINIALSKCASRKKLFTKIPLPPNFCKTRFGDWLKIVEYYSKQYIFIKEIVNEIIDDDAIVKRVKKAVS
ncbi:hypothetical protein A3Q56_08239 [Intoshia linei]|uniref:Uncharacterized protein n=1 Tax=Intoshia linei TaxID=1819745 RepID=A0A177APY1_9BILA|nr:hypothetical protein A3Q56_08239 [Intoshia linei]